MKRTIEKITKSEAASRWNISAATVSKYMKKGMPVRPDGLLDWAAVSKWRERYKTCKRMARVGKRLMKRFAPPIEPEAAE
jgi:hypothetical protein